MSVLAADLIGRQASFQQDLFDNAQLVLYLLHSPHQRLWTGRASKNGGDDDGFVVKEIGRFGAAPLNCSNNNHILTIYRASCERHRPFSHESESFHVRSGVRSGRVATRAASSSRL